MRGKEGGCRGQSSGHAAAEMTVGYRPSGLSAPMAATIECSGGPHHRVRSSSRCPDMTRASDYLASEDQRSVFLGSLVVLSPSIYLIIFVDLHVCTGRGDLATLPVFETSEGLHVVFRLCHCHYLLVPLLADWLSSTVLASTTVSYLPVLKIWEHTCTCIGFICMAA